MYSPSWFVCRQRTCRSSSLCPGVDLGLEVLERLLPVDHGVAPAEQVEVDSVEDVDAHGPTLASPPINEPRWSSR